jgi:hypothetical protein
MRKKQLFQRKASHKAMRRLTLIRGIRKFLFAVLIETGVASSGK